MRTLPWKLVGNENVTVGQHPECPNKFRLVCYPNLGTQRRVRVADSTCRLHPDRSSRRRSKSHAMSPIHATPNILIGERDGGSTIDTARVAAF
jgi:hypothetical protein